MSSLPRAALVALAAGLVLAGCSQPLGHTASGDLAAATLGGNWTSVLAGPGGDAESSLAVSKDGQTILACSHGGFTQPSPLWASTDGGATFTRVTVSPNQPFDGDCDVAITDDGSWNIVYDTVASSTFASSKDQGKTWWVHPFASEPVGGVDRPWILANGNEVVLTWADVMAALPFVGWFTKTSDGGRTWGPHVPIATFTQSDVYCFTAHPIVSPQHHYQVPLACKSNDALGDGPVYLLDSPDGIQWSKLPTGLHAAGSVTGSYAGDGGLWMTLDEADAQGSKLGVVHSSDGGKSFGPTTWVDGNVTPGFGWYWIDGRPDGTATAAWMDTADNSTKDKPVWQASVARLHAAADEVHIMGQGHVGPTAQEAPLYEFFMVRHDAAGHAFLAFPQITGPDCKQAGTIPSQVGSQDTPRNQQCIYVVRES